LALPCLNGIADIDTIQLMRKKDRTTMACPSLDLRLSFQGFTNPDLIHEMY
jgi:hypothetical protein